jgi:hypothetical protein
LKLGRQHRVQVDGPGDIQKPMMLVGLRNGASDLGYDGLDRKLMGQEQVVGSDCGK